MRPILLLIFYMLVISGTKLPPNFKKCNRKQPDLKQCVFEAAQHGVTQLTKAYKKLRFPSLEPLEVSEFSTHVETQFIRMDENLTNCKFFRLTNMILNKLEFDLEKKFINSVSLFPAYRSKCNYKINGNILCAPIQGQGNSFLNFKNFNLSFYITYNEIKRRNKTYIKVASCEMYGKPELIHFKLDNLFNGDEEAGKQANKLLNDNWNVLYADIKSDYFFMMKQVIVHLFNSFFSKLSLEEAFD